MIVKIAKAGRDLPGLAAYLWGPGKAEEHTEQRMIASTGAGDVALGSSSMFFRGERATLLDDATLSSKDARAEGRHLEASWRFFRDEAQVLVPAGEVGVSAPDDGIRSSAMSDDFRVDEPAAAVERHDGRGWDRPHVMHVVFSLRADEGELSDETWGRIASDWMREMKLAGNDGQADCRWGAWRHGKSASGNDHMHVAVSLVRDDGRWANTHRSMMRSRAIADDLEKKYGLRPMKDTAEQRGMPAASRGELRRVEQAKPGTREEVPERQRLAMIVRTAAVHAGTEKQFVADVLRQGVRVRPRFAKGGTDEVVGASFRFRDSADGQWLKAGSLGRDLTLPKLRQMWSDTPQERAEALEVWRGKVGVSAQQSTPSWSPSWNAAQQALATWAARIEHLEPTDAGAWVRASRDAAAVASELAQGSGGRQHQLLAGATQELARGAQTRHHVQHSTAEEVRVACRHVNLLMRAGSRSDAAGWWAVWQQFSRVNQAIHSAQKARGEHVRAQRLETAARTELQTVGSGLRKAAAASTTPPKRAEPARRTPTTDTQRGEERGR
ncbi:relaxase/mobilization nuclease domain-containing protein [Janibacter terrae]|uniref:relaxase/mobilization nuclease domain-containing protein n=1 Tax=Janibacter terrae TaxID=103817 RepID=UPI0031F8C167